MTPASGPAGDLVALPPLDTVDPITASLADLVAQFDSRVLTTLDAPLAWIAAACRELGVLGPTIDVVADADVNLVAGTGVLYAVTWGEPVEPQIVARGRVTLGDAVTDALRAVAAELAAHRTTPTLELGPSDAELAAIEEAADV